MYRKFKNKKVKMEGLTFDSKKEFTRWKQLIELQKKGVISNLNRQVSFVLIPPQKLVPFQPNERAVTYIADFVYLDNNALVIEDVKSKVTKKQPEYIIKRKLVKYFYCGGDLEIGYKKAKEKFKEMIFDTVKFNEFE